MKKDKPQPKLVLRGFPAAMRKAIGIEAVKRGVLMPELVFNILKTDKGILKTYKELLKK